MKKLFPRIIWIVEKTKAFSHYFLIITILGALAAVLGIYRALVGKWLVDAATTANISSIYQILIILAVLLVSDVGLKAVISFLTAKGSIRISNIIQQKLFERIIKTKFIDFLKYHSGNYLTRITSDVDAVTNMVVNIIPNIVSFSFLIIGSFITIFYFDTFLAVLISIACPVTIIIARFYSSKIKKIYLKGQEVESKYRSFLNESIQNLLIVKTFCMEKSCSKSVRMIQSDKMKLVLDRMKLSIASNSFMSVGTWFGFFIVFLWGSVKLSNGTTTFGTLMALIQLIGNIQGPFSSLAASLPQVVYSVASTERLMEIDNLQQDIEGVKVENMNSAGLIFENVNFSYKPGVPVLRNVTLNINPGEIVALVGPSGEGKTTFIHLILSLFSPENGHVFIYDALKKVEVSANIRNLISYVPQGNNLFSGTIAENLRFGSPNATDDELETAARAACAWEFIKNLQDGLNTHIGERGMGLSEGQAQRIAIARALLHKAPILLLDEATSALDANTEVEVLKTIKNLSPTPTCIIITHRTAALEICHKVLKIENNFLQVVKTKEIA